MFLKDQIKLFIIFGRKKYFLLMMKGYKVLSKSNKLYLPNLIKNQISKEKLIIDDTNKEYQIDFELSIRQFLIDFFVNRFLTRKILIYFGNPKKKIILPLPDKWIKVIENHNIACSKLCKYYFYLTIFIIFTYNIFYYFLFLLKTKIKKNINLNETVLFYEIIDKNLPKNNNVNERNIFSWHYNSHLADIKFDKYIHLNNKLKSSSYKKKEIIYLNIFYYESLVHFFKINIINSIFFKNFFWMLTGKWWKVLLFKQILLFEILKFKKSNLPEQCFFHNSINSFRPLWSYVFKKYNKDVHYFYYSTNLENIKFNTELSLLEHNFVHLHSWDNYVVWDNYQKKYLEKYLITKPIFSVVGYVDFYNLSLLNLKHNRKFLSIFDVSPFREFYINNICNNNEYYNFKNIKKFILDILKIADELNLQIIHKPKKIVSKDYSSFYRTDKKYINLLKSLSRNKNYRQISPDYSSYELIKNSSLVISIPYTSTSLIAKLNNIKSVYYDPSNKLEENRKITHDITLINNYDLLKNYIIKSF